MTEEIPQQQGASLRCLLPECFLAMTLLVTWKEVSRTFSELLCYDLSAGLASRRRGQCPLSLATETQKDLD